MNIGNRPYNRYVYATHKDPWWYRPACIVGLTVAACAWVLAIVVWALCMIVAWPFWMVAKGIRALGHGVIWLAEQPRRFWT